MLESSVKEAQQKRQEPGAEVKSESGSVPSMLHNNSGMEISERKKTKDGTSDGTTIEKFTKMANLERP